MGANDPLQTDELTTVLESKRECAIVHFGTRKEVKLYFYEPRADAPWVVSYSAMTLPEWNFIESALEMGFALTSRKVVHPFKREQKPPTAYNLVQNCFEPREAAVQALEFIRMLPGVGKEDWVWVTEYEYDRREVPPPKPPSRWPPRADDFRMSWPFS